MIEFNREVVSVDKIKLDKNRMRKDLGDIDELAESILTNGLMTPIIVDNDYTLIAGERRYLATKRAGLKEIPVSRASQKLNPVETLILEYTENDKRKDFTWQEKVMAEAKFFERAKEKDETITAKKVAHQLGISPGQLSVSLQLYKAIQKHEQLYSFPSKENAYKAMKRLVETALIAEKIARQQAMAEKTIEEAEQLDEDETTDDLTRTITGIQKRVSQNVKLGDIMQHWDSIPDKSIHLALCDPPWGVDINENAALGATKHFKDDKDFAFDFLEKLLTKLKDKMADNSIILLFFPLDLPYYKHVAKIVKANKLRLERTPMIWYKARESVANRNPHGCPGVVYEPIYFIAKGMPYITVPVTNVFMAKLPTGRVHPTQKPMELYVQLIQAFSNPGDTIFDPTYGSGASMCAAEYLGDRLYFGYEVNDLAYVRAVDNVIRIALKRKEAEYTVEELEQTISEELSEETDE